MFILAFSLDWFTTVPGILISVGVVLLIVAIILFATGNKKDKTKAVTNSTQEEVNVTPVEPVTVVETQPVVDTVSVEEQSKFDDIPMGTPGVDPINPVDTTVDSEADSEIAEVPTEIKVEEPIAVDIPVVQPEVSVYGGTDPMNMLQSVSIEEPKKTTIYGGNDPLEATQSLPKVEEAHLPYGGAIDEVKFVEPIVEPVEVPSAVEEPIQVEMPSVVEEPISFEIPSAPVEIPSVVEEPIETPSVVQSAEVEVNPVVEEPVIPVVEEVVQEKPVIEEL